MRAQLLAREALGTFRASVARRRERDRQRIAEYFDRLVEDARAPRRNVAAAAIAAKVEHLEAERRAKLADLDPRFAVRATVIPGAVVVVTTAVTRVSDPTPSPQSGGRAVADRATRL